MKPQTNIQQSRPKGRLIRLIFCFAVCLATPVLPSIAAGQGLGRQASALPKAQSASESASPCAVNSSQKMEEPTSARPTELTSVHTCVARDFTRVVIGLAGPVKYQASRLENPSRIYFDLHDANLSRAVLGKPIEVEGDVVKNVHVAQNQAGTVRIVLQAAAGSEYSVALLKAPYRMIVDVYPRGAKPGETAAPAAPAPARPHLAQSADQTAAKPQMISTPFGEMRAPPHANSPVQPVPHPDGRLVQGVSDSIGARR